MLPKFLKALGWVLLFFVLIVGLLVVSPRFSEPLIQPLRTWLVSATTKWISLSLNGTFEIGRLRGSLLSAPVFHDVMLKDEQGEVVAQIDAVALHYDLKGLLKKGLRFSAIEIIRPKLRLVQAADGRLNLSRLLAPELAEKPAEEPFEYHGPPVAILLDRVTLQDGRIDLELPFLPGVRIIENIFVDIQGEVNQQGLRFELQRFTADTQPANVALKTLRGTFQMAPGKMEIVDLLLATNHSQITLDGTLPARASTASLVAEISPVDVIEIGRLLGDDSLHGVLRAKFTAEGPAEALRLQTQLMVDKGRIDFTGHVNALSTPVRYRTTLDITHLDMADVVKREVLRSDINMHLKLTGEGSTLADFKGALRWHLDASRVGEIILNPSEIHLNAESQRFSVETFKLKTSVLEMSAKGDLNLAGASNLDYQLSAKLHDLHPWLTEEALNGIARLQGKLRGEGTDLMTDGTLRAENLQYRDHSLKTLNLEYAATRLGAKPNLNAELKAEQAHSGAFEIADIAVQTNYQGDVQQLLFALQVRQSAQIETKTQGTLAFSHKGQTLRLEEFETRLDDRLWQAVSPLELTLAANHFHLNSFRLRHADESIEISGGIHDQQLQDLQLQVAKLDLDFLKQVFSLPAGVGGRVNVQALLNGTRDAPVFDGSFELSNTAQQAFPFELAHLNMQYSHQIFQSKLDLSQNNRNVLTGDIHLPVHMTLTPLPLEQRLIDAPLKIHLDVKHPDLTALQQSFPNLPKLSGSIQGKFDLFGSFADLVIDTELDIQQLGVKGTVEQIQAPVQIHGNITTAASVADFSKALAQGQITPNIRDLSLSIPTLKAQLPKEGASQPLVLKDVRLEADAVWGADGLQGKIHSLRLQGHGLSMPPMKLALKANLTPQELVLQQLHINTADSDIKGEGNLILRDDRLRFGLDIDRLELKEFVKTFPAELPSMVQGKVDLTGSLQAPKIDAKLQYADARIEADVSALLKDKLPSYVAKVGIAGLDIEKFVPKMKGVFQAALKLRGSGFTEAERFGQLQLAIDSKGFNLAPELSVRARTEMVGSLLEFKDFRIDSLPIKLTAKGALSTTQQSALTYRLTLGELTSLQNYLGVELQAKGNVIGKLRGPFKALFAQTRLQLSDWRYANWQGENLGATLSVTNLPAAPDVEMDAWISGLQGPGLSSSSLELKGNLRQPEGEFSFNITEGPYAQSMFTGKLMMQQGIQMTIAPLRLQGGDWAWENTGPIHLTYDSQGTIRLQDFSLDSGEQRINLQASSTREGVIEADVHVEKLQMLSTIRAFSPSADVPDGLLSLDLKVSGTLTQPKINGNLGLSALRWQKQALGDIGAKVNSKGTTLESELRWVDQTKELLTLEGSVDTSQSRQVDLSLKASDFDLTSVSSFSKEIVNSAGQLDLDLKVTGRLDQPTIDGVVDVRDGQLQLLVTGEHYRDIQTRLLFKDNRMEIEQLQVGSQTGVARLEGWVTRTDLTLHQLELRLKADKFTAMNTSAIQATVSSDVSVQGSLEEMVAAGEIDVSSARIRYENLPTGGVEKVEPWQLTVDGVYGSGPPNETSADAKQSVSHKQNPLPFLRTDIKVDMRRNVWVQGQGTAVELGGDFHIKKRLREPFVLAGSIETLKGFATVLGKKFNVEKGIVTFAGTKEINPTLDVTASHKVSDYTVYVDVTGESKKPKLDFRSEPELDREDVLSLLIIGKTSDRLSSSEQNSLSNKALQLAGNLAAGVLEETLGKAFGLNIIAIDPGVDEDSAGSIGAGRYINQDLFLSYEREFRDPKKGNRGGNAVGLEYSINRNLKMKGSSSDLGETALDFYWGFDY
jgi:autotransporter translocation and assembly factor TamB